MTGEQSRLIEPVAPPSNDGNSCSFPSPLSFHDRLQVESNPMLEYRAMSEAGQYDDVIQGNFNEHLRNQTLQVLVGLKWVAERCGGGGDASRRDVGPKFILITKDDSFVHVFKVVEMLKEKMKMRKRRRKREAAQRGRGDGRGEGRRSGKVVEEHEDMNEEEEDKVEEEEEEEEENGIENEENPEETDDENGPFAPSNSHSRQSSSSSSFSSSSASSTSSADYFLCVPNTNISVMRNATGDNYRWNVTPDEFPAAVYPSYCNSVGFFLPGDGGMPQRLVREAQKTDFLFVYDVFLTGVLRDKLTIGIQAIHEKKVCTHVWEFVFS